MSFNQFRLSSEILKGLKDLKIESPSPIQKKIYNAVKPGNDLVINITADQKPELGYLLSLLNDISRSERRQGTRAIVLASTAERAKQIDEWIWAIGYHSQIESACFTPGSDLKKDLSALSAGPVIVVSIPGYLAEVLEEARMVFREVQALVVDEAEKVENWDAVDAISKRVIGKCQRIFTASQDSKELREAENSLLNEPVLVKLAEKAVSGNGEKEAAAKEETKEKEKPAKEKKESKPAITGDLTQYYINVPPRSKISTLMAHLDQNKTDTVVIFAASRRTADRLYKILRKSNKRAVSVHDKIDKGTFDERFQKFTDGDVQHLIIGELSAKDMPLEHATQVINYDVPEEVEEYKLRAELVGSGQATKILSLVSKQDRGDIKQICESLGYAPEEVPLPKSVKEQASKSQKSKPPKSKPKKKSISRSGSKDNNKRGRSNQKRQKEEKKTGLDALPRPSYDKLSGGRTGKKKEEKGIKGFFKKLFS